MPVDFGQSVLYSGRRTFIPPPIESGLLHILPRPPGQAVAAPLLLSRVWPGQNIEEETLRVHIHRLRRRVEPDPCRPRYSLTARGVGYCFALTERAPASAPASPHAPFEEPPAKPAE